MSTTSADNIYDNDIIGIMKLSDAEKIKIVHERYEFVYSQYIAHLLACDEAASVTQAPKQLHC